MRQFQELGHEVMFLIGDFTGMIGDPPGERHAAATHSRGGAGERAHLPGAGLQDPRSGEDAHRFQLAVAGRDAAAAVVELAAKYTVARMLERDDFAKRFKSQQPISVHEFFYPLVQGYDSVALRADVELGGTDQKFNLLVGRQLQEGYGQEPQFVLTMPLLEGLDGVNKMSKSLGNYVGIAEDADAKFGKLMSISDELMWRYFELLSFRPITQVQACGAIVAGRNPRDVKFELAQEIVARFHGEPAARAAQEDFIARFPTRRLAHGSALAGGAGAQRTGENIVAHPEGRRVGRKHLRGGAQNRRRGGADRWRQSGRRELWLPQGAEHMVQVGPRRFARVKIGKAQ